MDFVQVVALSALWFLAGRTWTPKPAPKLKSTGDVLEEKLWDQFAGLKSNLRFVGQMDGLKASVWSEWKFGGLGRARITLEPLPDTAPAAETEVG